MRILIATDAWRPQINGVVHSLEQMSIAARTQGVEIDFLTPQGFHTVPMPTYPEVRLALASWGAVARRIEATRPDHIHIATEGPIGFAARHYCKANKRVFTTSYHTRFPEYVAQRVPIPERWSYAALRRFHAPAAVVMVPTPTIRDELTQRGFARVKVWSRGVDHLTFRPRDTSVLDFPRPIFLCVGRVAVEKNLGAFLSLKLPGSKVIVGDGPARASLEQKYPHVHFLGARSGEILAQTYASADVFVFPSRTDTFGLVNLEAMACGVPVAAYPVTGPIDIVTEGVTGALDEDLSRAAHRALRLDPAACRERALRSSWESSSRQFEGNLTLLRTGTPLLAGAAALLQ